MNAFSQRTNNLTNKDNKLKLKLKTLNNIQIGTNNNEKLNNIKQIVENIRKYNINFAKDTRHTLSTIAILNEANLPSSNQPHNTTPSNPSSIPSHKRTHSKGRSLTTLKTLKDENREMRKQIDALQRENSHLKEENYNLKLKLTACTTTTSIESNRTINNGMYYYNNSVPNLFMSNSHSSNNGNRSYNKQGCSLNSSVCNNNVGATSLSKVPFGSRMEKKKRQLLMFNVNNNFISTTQPSSVTNNNSQLLYHNYSQHTYNIGDKQRVLSANKKTIQTNSLNDCSWCYNASDMNCKFNVKMLNQIKMRMFKLLNFYESVYNGHNNSNNRMLYSNYISDNPLSRNKNITRTNSENSRQSSNYIYNSNYSNYGQVNSDINNLKYRLNNPKTVYVVKNNNLTIA